MNVIAVIVVLVVVGNVTATHAITPKNEDEIKNWSKYYQTDESASKEKNAKELLEKNIQPPNDAYKSAFNVAKIFDGDKGFTTQGLTNTLLKVGAIESMNWASNRQQTDNDKKGERTGVGRSYWSVEPSTALDLAKNSGYLGNNFNTYFKRYEKGGMSAKDTFASMTKEEIGDLLMNDQDLAAAFAAAKIVTTYPSLKKE